MLTRGAIAGKVFVHQRISQASCFMGGSRMVANALLLPYTRLRALGVALFMCCLTSLLSSVAFAEFERTTRFFGPSRMTTEVVIADFNRDGHLDLVAVNRDEGEERDDGLRLLLGKENGTFQDPGKSISVRTGDLERSKRTLDLMAAVSGDFNQDNNPDLAVLAQAKPGRILILLGDGNGSFPLANRSILRFGERAAPSAMAVGDFDQSGTTDLAVIGDDSLYFFDDPSRTSLPRKTIKLESPSRSLAVGNINADTIPDVIIAQDSSVSILLGRDSFEFESPLLIEQRDGVNPRSVAIADMDQDGSEDILVAHNGTLSTATIYFGNGFGQFPNSVDVGSPATTRDGPHSVAIGDFDKDGNQDFAVVNSNFDRRNVTIFRGYAHSEDELYSESSHLDFEPYRTTPTTGLPKKIIDGEVDPNTGANRDLLFDSEDDEVPYALYIEDLDGDEDLDLVTANFSHNGIGLLIYERGFIANLAVSFVGTGTGQITARPGPNMSETNCFNDCTIQYDLLQPPTSVTLTPTPTRPSGGQLSIFSGWTGCLSTSGNQCTVEMGSDQQVTATFVEPVIVPNVVGQTQGAAGNTLSGANLSVGNVTQQASGNVAVGNVISQNPTAGASVAPGSNVNLVVSSGPAQVTVPNVVGQTQGAAGNTLSGANLSVGNVTQQASGNVAVGNVISQNPTAGASVAPGSNVNLVVSSGPAQVTVPNVVGQTQGAAGNTLSGANLSVGNVTQQASGNVAVGNVISQNPTAGASVAPGSNVNLVVSSGPAQVTVPNVVGQTQGAAGNTLSGANLSVGNVTQQASGNVAVGNVISQNPTAGASVAPGSNVNLVVSSGPAQVTVPNVVGQTQGAAGNTLSGANLSVGNVTQQASGNVAVGNVISQNPTAGASVAPGSNVNLVVSSGPAQVTVPNVVGQTQGAAGQTQGAAGNTLSGANLSVGNVTQQASGNVAVGNVISQNPTAGASVAPGSNVNLVVSSGPAQVTVPNVVGQTQGAAGNTLSGANLSVGNVTQQASGNVAVGNVISQNPTAGASVAPGSNVNLVVSSGPAQVTVPNVVGQTQGAAGNTLSGANLSVGNVTQQSESDGSQWECGGGQCHQSESDGGSQRGPGLECESGGL